tara:strand:+ start:160 stop:369 length:210 start_codon:yes stop_codon:yes gene_type:complete
MKEHNWILDTKLGDLVYCGDMIGVVTKTPWLGSWDRVLVRAIWLHDWRETVMRVICLTLPDGRKGVTRS